MRRVRPGLAAHLVLLLLLVMAACGQSPGLPPPSGEGNRSADQVLADAQVAMAQVHAYRVTSSNESRDGRSSFDFAFDAAGNLAGSLRTGPNSADVVVVGGQPYIRGNAFWSSIYSGSGIPPAKLQAILEKIGTHFVHDQADVLSLVRDARQLLPADTPDCMAVHGVLSRGGLEVLNGQRVVVVKDDGSEPGGMPARYLVADASPHRLLQVESHGPQTPGQQAAHGTCPAGITIGAADVDPSRRTTFSFSQFDTIDPINRPPDSVEIPPQ